MFWKNLHTLFYTLDIFVFPDDQLLALVTSGVLEPIENSEEIKDLYLEGAIEAGSVNGDMYAYPLTADNGYFLYYDNNDLKLQV